MRYLFPLIATFVVMGSLLLIVTPGIHLDNGIALAGTLLALCIALRDQIEKLANQTTLSLAPGSWLSQDAGEYFRIKIDLTNPPAYDASITIMEICEQTKSGWTPRKSIPIPLNWTNINISRTRLVGNELADLLIIPKTGNRLIGLGSTWYAGDNFQITKPGMYRLLLETSLYNGRPSLYFATVNWPDLNENPSVDITLATLE